MSESHRAASPSQNDSSSQDAANHTFNWNDYQVMSDPSNYLGPDPNEMLITQPPSPTNIPSSSSSKFHLSTVSPSPNKKSSKLTSRTSQKRKAGKSSVKKREEVSSDDESLITFQIKVIF